MQQRGVYVRSCKIDRGNIVASLRKDTVYVVNLMGQKGGSKMFCAEEGLDDFKAPNKCIENFRNFLKTIV